MLIGIRHIGLIVSDIEVSKKFYTNFLGFKVIQHFEDSSEYINTITNTKNVNVEMVKMESPDKSVIEILKYSGKDFDYKRNFTSITSVGEAHIAIQVDNADNFYNKCIENDIKPISKPILSSESIAKVFFIQDPDKYRIEIVEILNLSI